MCLCRTLRPSSVLDLGSGFSSYVLALYASTATALVKVVSVDTDAEWLGRTAGFLDRQGLGNRSTLALLDELTPGRFDLVFHDLAGGETRERMMGEVCDRLTPDGVAVFDDMHHLGDFDAMRDANAERGMLWASLHQWTFDDACRFAVIATKGKP